MGWSFLALSKAFESTSHKATTSTNLCDEIEFRSAPPIPPTPICAVLKRLFFNCEINDDGKNDRDANAALFFKKFLLLLTNYYLLVINEEAGRPSLLNNVPSKTFFQAYLACFGLSTLLEEILTLLSMIVA